MFVPFSIVALFIGGWVYHDAKSIGVRKGLMPVPMDMSAAGWAVACCLFWVIWLPLYLSKRGALRELAAADRAATARYVPDDAEDTDAEIEGARKEAGEAPLLEVDQAMGEERPASSSQEGRRTDPLAKLYAAPRESPGVVEEGSAGGEAVRKRKRRAKRSAADRT